MGALPDDPGRWVDLGRLLRRLDRTDESDTALAKARSLLERRLSRVPDDEAAAAAMAGLLPDAGDSRSWTILRPDVITSAAGATLTPLPDGSVLAGGLNPVVDGALIRLPIPALNAERRQELVKVAHKYAEHARVAVRNVRRDGMELLKKLDKDGQMSEDDHHKNSAKVQELTDRLIKEIDQGLAGKEAEIKQV